MRIELIRRPERSTAMALLSPLIAVGADRDRRRRSSSPRSASIRSRRSTSIFLEPLTAAWSLAGAGGQGDPARHHRGRPVALLPVQHLEHRRRGPAHRSARSPGRSSRSSCPTSRTSLTLPLMLLMGIARRRGLCGDPGAPQDALRHQRDPDQPDAGLCRQLSPRLAGARSAGAIPQGFNFPGQPRLHRLPGAADPHPRQPRPPRARSSRWSCVAGGWFLLRRTHHRLPDHRPRPGAARRRLRRLQPQPDDRCSSS